MQVVEVWPVTLSGLRTLPTIPQPVHRNRHPTSRGTVAAPELPQDKSEINFEILDHANHTPFVPIQEIILIETLLSDY